VKRLLSVLLAAASCSALAAQGAGSPLVARIMPVGCTAPCDILVQAFIEPHASNRSVEFLIDSGAVYSSSTVELDGDRAPRSKEVRFREMPAGDYEIRVTLMGTDGERGGVVRKMTIW
jgi:hypothetical protein